MRLLLANGTIISVKNYNKTTAVVDGNSVAAISIVTNETLDSVNTKIQNTDALLDFNIYPDDKDVTLFHATGYQQHIRTILDEGADGVTIVLAKTTDTDIILKRVETLLNDIQKTQETQAVTIQALTDGHEAVVESLNTVGKNNSDLNKLVQAIGQSLTETNTSIKQLNNHIAENDELCNGINKAVSQFREISEQHIAQMSSMQEDFTTISGTAATAVNHADNAVNSIVEQNEVIQQMADTVAEANQKAQSATLDVENTVNAMTEVTKQVAEVSKLAQETNEKAADAESVKAMAESMATMKENISSMNETVVNTNMTVNNLTGQTIPVLTQTINNAQTVAQSAVETTDKLDERVTALEPVKDYTTLPLQDAIAYRVQESAAALAEYLATNPITSTCHKGIAAKYSITKDKQEYLQNMISVCTVAKQTGTPYHPSWNATGEVCSYDWTIEELAQLAMEIEATVRPLVSYQQTIENAIKKCTSMEELQTIVINYNNIPAHEIPTPSESESTSASESESASTSTSESNTETSESESASTSTEVSESESTSESTGDGDTSTSASESASEADATSESEDDNEERG